MPSFDVVSEVDLHELANAVDQANREVDTRFDFKGTKSVFQLAKLEITLDSQTDFQLQQMMDILTKKMVKRGVDIQCLDINDSIMSGSRARQTVIVRQGIETDIARKIVKMVKEAKIKVQSAIQGEQVRVSGKKRDDLQAVINLLKEARLNVPLQYQNFRD